MIDLLLRRRGLMISSDTPIAPIYEISSPVFVQNYDTGIQLFDTAKDFTILTEVQFNNRNWSGTESVLGINTTWNFRYGRGVSGTAYYDGALSGSHHGNNYYTNLILNAPNDSEDRKMTSLVSRMTTENFQTQRLAFRYDHSLLRGECDSNTQNAPSVRWLQTDSQLISNDTLKLNLGTRYSVVNILKIYDTLFTNAEVNDFLNSITPSLLPSAYSPLEYIQQSARGCADLNVAVTASDKIEVLCDVSSSVNQISTSGGYIVGCRQTNVDNTIGYGVSYQQDRSAIRVWDGTLCSVSGTAANRYNVYALKTSTGAMYISNTVRSTTVASSTPRAIATNLYVFGVPNYDPSGDVITPFYGNIYALTILVNDHYAVNLIPCKRIADSVVGFYDTVQERFITHSTFIGGPNI